MRRLMDSAHTGSGTNIRVEAVMMAKLFAEYISAIEDFGALIHAVRNRKDGGVFYQYSECRSQVERIFNDLSKTELDVPMFLGLPGTSDLLRGVAAEDLFWLSTHYDSLATEIMFLAETYTRRLPKVEYNEFGNWLLPKNWTEYLWIVLEYKPSDKVTAPREVRLIVEAFNKIKHRFLVIEDFKSLFDAIDDNDLLLYSHEVKSPELAEAFLNSIAGVVTRQRELAMILVRLNELGVM